ncbi:MAG: N-formylglutamate amidohydrolase [Acidobacteriota bacterium]
MIIHIPHASTDIPSDVRSSILLSDEELRHELLIMTDLYTNEVRIDPGLARVIVAPVSRLVVDVERFRNDADEPMSQAGMGAVYTSTHKGRELRTLTQETRQDLLGRYFDPHHRELARAARAALQGHGRCLIIDVHSFSDAPLPHEPTKEVPRPDVCLGTDPFHTPGILCAAARRFFEGRGLVVKENAPFAGTMVPTEFYKKDKRVSSIMVEMNRKWLSDPRTGARVSTTEGILAGLGEWIRYASGLMPGLV